MKKFGFFWFWLLVVISCGAGEMRGIWVDAFGPGFLNKAQVKQMVADCRKYKFNAVFVQMRKRGDAFYMPKTPNPDPRTQDIPPDFDALQTIIDECHNGEPRIQVHCWLVGYFIWAWEKSPKQPSHLFNARKDLLMKDSLGQTILGQGFYLDPGNPESSVILLNVAKDVVRGYDVDGLHWDHLRYPEQDSGYNDVAIKRYKNEFALKQTPSPDDRQFSEWRRRQVTDFLRWSTAELLAIKPKLIVSASVFSNYTDSRDYRFQDWVAWNKEGIIDVSVPMDFSPDNARVFEPRADFALTNQWNRKVWIGQAGYMNSKENTVKQLDYCHSKGFSGFLLYSYRNSSAETIAMRKASTSEDTFASRTQVIVDNANAQFVGDWKTNRFGKPYGTDYRFKEKGNGDAYGSFAPKLPESGQYEVLEWHVAGPNRGSAVPHKITSGTNIVTVVVDQQSNGGRWNSLGKFQFNANSPVEVRITDDVEKSNYVAVADAVRFVLSNENRDSTITSQPRAEQIAALQYIAAHLQPRLDNDRQLVGNSKRAGGVVKGILTDNLGLPIYNATVRIDGNREQRTEPHGAFAFFDVVPGSHRIEATLGKNKVIEQVSVDANSIVTTVNLKL